MTQDKYDSLTDGSIRIHEGAPDYVKDSFLEDDQLINNIVNFSEKRTSLLDGKHGNENGEHMEELSIGKTLSQIKVVLDSDSKKEIAGVVLDDLVDWFGIESAKQEYITESANMPFWACYQDTKPIGFLALKKHNKHSAEVYVMGILKQFHHEHHGISLMKTCEKWCAENGIQYLQVKTVDASSSDEYYAETRAFYTACNFVPLEVFPTLWDEHNPCLLMIKGSLKVAYLLFYHIL